MRLKPLSLVFLSAAATLPTLAIAQSRGALEEIIVTAQKREEALQDVPIAISALSADTLAKQGIKNLNDFQVGQVPSLKVVQFAGRPNALLFGIRGITETDPVQLTQERPVAIYVDGVYIARGNGMDTEVFDIERMEVLRGPQGTLFGRNAMGGALSITTRKPTGNFGFKQELEASTLDEYKSRSIIDTPEWNGLSANLSYLHRQANGWVNNPGGARDYNWQNKNAYRLALEYKTGDVVVDYSYDHSNVDYMQNYNTLIHKPAVSINPRPVDGHRVDSGLGTSEPVQNTENDGHNLTVDWSATDSLTFKSITGYRNLKDNNSASAASANAYIPGAFVGLGPNAATTDPQSMAVTRQNQLSQEFQLIGDLDRLEWQAGLMYFHEDGSFDGWTNTVTDMWTCPGGTNCTNRVLLPSTLTPFRDNLTNVSTDSYGVFAQATWNPDILEDRLKITLGLRYGKDDKDIARPKESGGAVNIKANAKSERVDPALTLSYNLLDDTSVYVRYSTAYRGGGVSVREVNTFSPYQEESVAASEIGLKSVFWDNRARINAAAFYSETDQLITPVQQTDCGPNACSSANTKAVNVPGTARMHGFEFEGSVLVIDGLTLSLAYTYLDNSIPAVEYQENARSPVFLRQPTLNNAPRNSWAVNVDYQFEPFSFGQLNAHIDVTDSDEYCFSGFSCKPDAIMIRDDTTGVHGGDDNTLINARLTLSDIRMGGAGSLQAALWVKNLTDEEYINFGYTAPSASSATGNNTIGQYGDPRSVGVTLTYQY